MYFNSLQLRSNSRSFGQEIADKLAVCSILHELFSGDVSVTILVYDSSQVLNTRHQHVLILLHLRKPVMSHTIRIMRRMVE